MACGWGNGILPSVARCRRTAAARAELLACTSDPQCRRSERNDRQVFDDEWPRSSRGFQMIASAGIGHRGWGRCGIAADADYI